jgi:uncharacterized protein YjbI with pentapeptide repeats
MADVTGANLTGANLTGANLTGAKLKTGSEEASKASKEGEGLFWTFHQYYNQKSTTLTRRR